MNSPLFRLALSRFKLVITTRGRLPYTSKQKLTIDEKGQCSFSFQPDQVGSNEVIEKFTINKAKVKKIPQIIQKNDFPNIQSRDSGILDGDQVQMIITSGTKKHSVTLTNFKDEKFNKIIRAQNKILPKQYRVSYNALVLER